MSEAMYPPPILHLEIRRTILFSLQTWQLQLSAQYSHSRRAQCHVHLSYSGLCQRQSAPIEVKHHFSPFDQNYALQCLLLFGICQDSPEVTN
jgi:hypothetical protein